MPENSKITVFNPVICKTPDVPLLDKLPDSMLSSGTAPQQHIPFHLYWRMFKS